MFEKKIIMAEFREGFLCPICMADLGDENQLIVHFDEKHSREDPAIVQNFKDLFSRAKNKIINKVNVMFNIILEANHS